VAATGMKANLQESRIKPSTSGSDTNITSESKVHTCSDRSTIDRSDGR